MPFHSPLTPAQLVQRLLAGNPEAIEILCNRYAPSIRRTIRRLMGLDSEVEDLVQDVFIQVLEGALHKLQDPNKLESYLLGISRNLCRKKRKWRKIRQWIPFCEENELGVMTIGDNAHEALRRLYTILDSIDSKKRDVFVLHKIDERELSDIAAAMKLSLSTVKRALKSATEIIRARAEGDPELFEYTRPLRSPSLSPSNTDSERALCGISIRHRSPFARRS